jgi:hypothetical protein
MLVPPCVFYASTITMEVLEYKCCDNDNDPMEWGIEDWRVRMRKAADTDKITNTILTYTLKIDAGGNPSPQTNPSMVAGPLPML